MKTKQKPAAKKSPKKSISLVIPAQPTSAPAPAPAMAPTTDKLSRRRDNLADHAAIATQIATRLGETKPWPRRQIRHIIWALGPQQTLDLVRRAQEIHAGEGLLIANGQRKRTVGGVFFHLCYTTGKPRPGRELKRPDWKRKAKQETGSAPEAVKHDEPVQ